VLPQPEEDEVAVADASAAEDDVAAEDEVLALVSGELTWSRMVDVPSQFLAIAAAPDGFLAAAPASGGGVDFWTSADGEAWELLASDQSAFETDEVVHSLSGGPSGFVAGATRLGEDQPASAAVWTSPDGETWHRSSLTAGLADPETGHGIEFGDSPTGAGTFSIVDSVTGEELVLITEDDIVAAEQAAIEAEDPGRAEPDVGSIELPELLAFSTDGTTWAIDEVTLLFGEDASIFRVAVGADRVVALIPTNFEALMWYAIGEDDAEPPPIEVWVGEPGE
jgi:hypothetical protein